MQQTVENVHSFWFGEIVNGFTKDDRSSLWFRADKHTDALIKMRFERLVNEAADGALDDWRKAAKGRLVLIILLDQFPRNIYRGTKKAFETDPIALDLCLEGIAANQDRKLAIIERSFLYMPLEHSEDSQHQQLCVQLFTRLVETLPEWAARRMQASLAYAVSHKQIIDRFGRFPHRNKVLGRDSTPKEIEFLQIAGTRFGQ